MIIIFKKGDLLKSKGCLAHTVSGDMKMSRGIASQFRYKFGGINLLKNQRRNIGDTPYITNRGRKIFYLITKEKFWHKPRLSDIEEALENLKEEMLNREIKSISMPKIGTGLDCQKWVQIYSILIKVFNHTDFTINIYSL